MLCRLSIALLSLSAALSPLPLRAQERVPSEREIGEFNKNFLDTMVEFFNDKEVSESLGIFSVISLAIYNCELVVKGIVKPSAIYELLSQYHLNIYNLPNIAIAIRMQSSALSDYIVFPITLLDFAIQGAFYRNLKAFQ